MSKYCCSECGGTNIQVQAWINPDTCDVLVFEDLESAWEEANRCQNGIAAMLST